MEENIQGCTSISVMMEKITPYLPAMSDLYGTLSLCQRKKDSSVVFYTDDHKECVLYTRDYTDYVFFCFTEFTEKRRDDMVNSILPQKKEHITLSMMDIPFTPEIITAFENAHYETYGYKQYVIASSRPFYRKGAIHYADYTKLPLDYSFVDLKVEHAERIDSNWEYRNSDSLNHIRYLLSEFPSVGIQHNGNIVCWVLSHEYGAFGLLHTIEEYRKLGLAKKCIMKLLSLLDSNPTNEVPPFSYIHTENNISLMLHKQLGFEIGENKMNWIQMKKTGGYSQNAK